MERERKRRRRPALSCNECHRRKIKCDRKEPCSHCVSVRHVCVFNVYGNEPASQQKSPQDGGPPNASEDNVVHSSRIQELESTIRDLQERVKKLEGSKPDTPDHALPNTDRKAKLKNYEDLSKLHQSEIILYKSRSLGRTRPLHKPEQIPPPSELRKFLLTNVQYEAIVDCYAEAIGHGRGTFQDAETRLLVVRMGDLLKECKAIARTIKSARPSRSLNPDIGLELPSREVADTMVKSYFASFESTHRILHVPTFWNEYRRFWDNTNAASNHLRLKILLVIGIGFSLSDGDDIEDDFRYTVHNWIYVAQTWLSGPLEKDRLNITGLQIYCLVMLARHVFSLGGDLVWVSSGSLIHRAMQIGLHHDPKTLPRMPVLQAEVRRRLWATVLEMAVQSSLDAGMPPRVSFDEFDTEAPANVNDEEMDELTLTLQAHPRATYTTTSTQLLLFDSLPARLRMLHLLNGFRSELLYEDVLRLSSEITDACQAGGRFLSENTKSGVTPFHRNFFDLLTRRFLIWLHMRFFSEARKNPLFYYSLKTCLDAAMAVVSPEPDSYFSRLMVIGGGLFKETFRYASTIILLELMSQVETQSLDGTLNRQSQHVNFLKQTARDLVALSLERVKHGETNVKGYMFLCMMMAQIEALEGNTSRELGIAQAAVNSLELCVDLLRNQTQGVNVPSTINTGFESTLVDWQDYGIGLDLDLFSADLDFF